MKVKLTTNEKDEFVGYKNVYYENISEIINNSCFELYCGDEVLKKIPNNQFSTFIKNCCSKIRHGGVFLLTGPDISKLALSYIHKYISEENLSDIIGGSIGFYNCKIIEKELKNNNIKIHSMSISDNNFIVRGIRD